ncbi:heme peroxidase 2-like isoform X2 [Mercenaria mercenaria]|nr:heme peroxidase 2-like isoform X2 [Mercenaria mercenaria]
MSAAQLDGLSSLQDFVALRQGQSSPDISTRTISDAVSQAMSGIETKLSSKEALDRSAFNAGVDRVSIAATDQFGPQHLTSQAALDIEQAGQAFLETASTTAKRLNVPASGISSQFSKARIMLPDFKILPRRLECPFQKSKWPTCDRLSKYRTLDGSCNNLNNRLWGKSFTPFERYLTPAYDDGISDPRKRSVSGGWLPNARKISREFHLQLSNKYKDLTHLAMEYGQFISHDIQFNALSKGYRGSNLNCCERPNRKGCFPITIPPGDPFFTNRTCLNLVRALPTPNLECTLGIREQLNQNTHFIDASHIYGSDKATSDSLRTFTGGLLKTSNDLLPSNSGQNAGCIITVATRPCFRAGDPRVNQQPALASLHTIWMREHNRIAKRLAQVQPSWQADDERLFQEARRIVVAMIQHITYKEYLPEILGDDVMVKYGLKPQANGFYYGYSEKEKPMIRNGFSAAVFRFGHSMISDHLPTHNGFIQTTNNLLKDTFLKPDLVYTRGVDELARGLTRSSSEKVDRYITAQVTRHLFERQPGQGGDLAATNIQRGRDHGLPNYQKWRRYCGLSGQYSHDNYIKQALQRLYSSPDDMDLFTAGVSETPVSGGKVGPTFACIIGEQFRSLKKGDRFYYENNEIGKFTSDQLKEIRRISMSKVICRNTGIPHIQRNAFKDIIPGNPLVNCRNLKDIDFSKWGAHVDCQTTGGVWSSWTTTPCFGNWRIRYRLCSNSAPSHCGNPCSKRYEVKVESCGWIWGPIWPRPGGVAPNPSFPSRAANTAQTNDMKSKIEAKVSGLINKQGNIDASIFERALSSVSSSMSRL